MTYDRYLGLSWYDRWAMHDSLTERLERIEEAAEDAAADARRGDDP